MSHVFGIKHPAIELGADGDRNSTPEVSVISFHDDDVSAQSIQHSAAMLLEKRMLTDPINVAAMAI